MMKKILLSLVAFLFILISCENGKSDQKADNTNKTLTVFAVNYPLEYFAHRIGGEHIDLLNLIPADIDPAYWVPKKELDQIQQADLILKNGADYAKWMEKVSLPSSKLVNTSQSMADKYIQIQSGETHSHGSGGEHVHYGYAFTTWLDFEIAIGQAKAIQEALMHKKPEHKAYFTGNFESLKKELTELDMRMKELSARLPKNAVFGSHPVYQYLAKAYGIEIVSEHWEPGEMPNEEQWKDFQHNLEHHPSNLMLWEGIPTEEVRLKLEQMIVYSVLFSPCANRPSEGDFMSVMRKNLDRLEKYIDEMC